MNRNVVRSTLTDQAYEIIKTRIIAGDYHSSERLTEQGIAKSMNLSATPVREAFNRLASEGFIVSVPYKGVFVKTYTLDEVKQAYMIRAKLQGLAIRFMMDKVTDDDVLDLESVFNKGLASNGNVFVRFQDFQSKIFELADSEIVIRSISPINAIINLERMLHLGVQPDADVYVEAMKAIMKNIKDKNVDQAIEISEKNIMTTMNFVISHYDKLNM